MRQSMKKFTFTVEYTEEQEIEVTAEDYEQAEEKAKKMADNDGRNYEYFELS